MKNSLFPILFLFICFLSSCKPQQGQISSAHPIHFNQIGFDVLSPKIAVVDAAVADSFVVRNQQTGKVMYAGLPQEPLQSTLSGRWSTVLDFSDLKHAGKYVIEFPGGLKSESFEIKNNSLYRPLGEASIRAFYYQRTGMPIEEKYAGQWHRPGGHPDTIVYIHPNAASPGRPAGTVISSPGGWYDAGDYNKYIVNSGFTVGLLMALAEDEPEYVRHLNLNIPESNNDTPDLLDEIHYNLAWMLTMQDPADGGVYHKLTTPGFEGFIRPEECRQKRYVVSKSVTATLDFAASMAQASRIYNNFSKDYPGFAEKALAAARAAYEWALKNPEAYYNQDELNKQFEPAVSTGTYGDNNAKDEFYWAAVELFSTTGEKKYLDALKKYQPGAFTLPAWPSAAGLGYMTLLRQSPYKQDFNITDPGHYNSLSRQLIEYCDQVIASATVRPYHTTSGNRAQDFGWGCLSEKFGNRSAAFFYAYKLSGDDKYLNYGMDNIDYILGRNPLGYCYVTGFGTKSPMHPHHRLAASDGIAEPLPGFLVGGPNPAQQDKTESLVYPSDIADESYIDHEASYASNEIAINWNASLAYVAVRADALLVSIRNENK